MSGGGRGKEESTTLQRRALLSTRSATASDTPTIRPRHRRPREGSSFCHGSLPDHLSARQRTGCRNPLGESLRRRAHHGAPVLCTRQQGTAVVLTLPLPLLPQISGRSAVSSFTIMANNVLQVRPRLFKKRRPMMKRRTSTSRWSFQLAQASENRCGGLTTRNAVPSLGAHTVKLNYRVLSRLWYRAQVGRAPSGEAIHPLRRLSWRTSLTRRRVGAAYDLEDYASTQRAFLHDMTVVSGIQRSFC